MNVSTAESTVQIWGPLLADYLGPASFVGAFYLCNDPYLEEILVDLESGARELLADAATQSASGHRVRRVLDAEELDLLHEFGPRELLASLCLQIGVAVDQHLYSLLQAYEELADPEDRTDKLKFAKFAAAQILLNLRVHA